MWALLMACILLHTWLTEATVHVEDLVLAFAQVECDMFSAIMRDVELNPHTILQAIEEHLHMMPSFAGRDLRVSPSTKLVFKLALHHASRTGRQTIEAADLFSAVFEE